MAYPPPTDNIKEYFTPILLGLIRTRHPAVCRKMTKHRYTLNIGKYPEYQPWYLYKMVTQKNRCVRKEQSLLFDLFKVFA